jgi:hypothetical protein
LARWPTTDMKTPCCCRCRSSAQLQRQPAHREPQGRLADLLAESFTREAIFTLSLPTPKAPP